MPVCGNRKHGSEHISWGKKHPTLRYVNRTAQLSSHIGESTSGGLPVAGNNRSKRALMGCVERCIQRRRASLQYSNGCPRCYVPPSLHSQTLRAVGSRIGESTSGGLPVAGNNRSKRALMGCVERCIQRRRASLQ